MGQRVKYEPTEQLLYWLTRWSGCNHALGGKVGTASVEGRLGWGGGGGTVCAEFQFPLGKLFEQTVGVFSLPNIEIETEKYCVNIHTAQRQKLVSNYLMLCGQSQLFVSFLVSGKVHKKWVI